MKKFTPEEVARMRHEMLTQYAPATTMDEACVRPKSSPRIVRGDDA